MAKVEAMFLIMLGVLAMEACGEQVRYYHDANYYDRRIGCRVPVVVPKLVYPKFDHETPCTDRNGYCLLKSNCPHSKLEKGLCPKQQSKGAECCHEIPDIEKDCDNSGGECIDNCPRTITHSNLRCADGLKCCIWL